MALPDNRKTLILTPKSSGRPSIMLIPKPYKVGTVNPYRMAKVRAKRLKG